MAATNMAFAKPPTTQQASPLMRLPAELRVKILDILLSRARTIKLRLASARPARRSAQLLRACQQLYSEGHTILYNKNVVAICFGDSEFHDHCLTLKRCVQVGVRLPIFHIEQYSLLDVAQAFIKLEAPKRDLDAERFVQLYPALMKIRNFRIHFRYRDQVDIFVQRRVLRALLNNKHVTCVLEPAPVAKGHTISWLKSCRILRCSSISFYKFNDTRFLEELRENITSRTIVRDTLMPWVDYLTHIAPVSRQLTESAFKDDCMKEFKELKQHMLNYDFDAYVVQQKYLMERAIEWNQLCAEAECQKLMDQKNQRNRTITAGLESDILFPKH